MSLENDLRPLAYVVLVVMTHYHNGPFGLGMPKADQMMEREVATEVSSPTSCLVFRAALRLR